MQPTLSLPERLKAAGLPAEWATPIEKISQDRETRSGSSSLAFGKGGRLDAAFREYDDHFDVFQNETHVASFTLTSEGTVEITFQQENATQA